MKEYKGLYFQEDSKNITYEHGAHFKYTDLVKALMDLQKNISSEKNVQNEKEESAQKEKQKKRKKYKLKLEPENTKNNQNQRYNDFDYRYNNGKENKNDDRLNIRDLFPKIQKIKQTSRSVDTSKDKLPIINNNISLCLGNKSNRAKILNEDNIKNITNEKDYVNKIVEKIKNNYNEVNKSDILPKINHFHFKEIKNRYENDKNSTLFEEEIKNQYNDIQSGKIYNHKLNSIKKFNYKKNHKLFLKDYNDNNNNNIEIGRIRSIFDTEKQIKKNINKKIYPIESKYVNTINNDINQQIYHLKKSLLCKS